jgi:TusA-related sulfurtransferase
MKANYTLDCIGLFCPMPIMKMKEKIDTMRQGEVLEVLADDPGFEGDLPAWCMVTGNVFLGIEKEELVLKGYVQKK